MTVQKRPDEVVKPGCALTGWRVHHNGDLVAMTLYSVALFAWLATSSCGDLPECHEGAKQDTDREERAYSCPTTTTSTAQNASVASDNGLCLLYMMPVGDGIVPIWGPCP